MTVEDDAGRLAIDASAEQSSQLDPARELYGLAWLLYTLARDAEVDVRRQVSAWSHTLATGEVPR